MSSRVLAIAGALATLAACGADIGGAAEPDINAHEDAPEDDLGLLEDDLGLLEDELGSLELALGSSCGSAGQVQRTFNSRATAFTATGAMQAQGCGGDSYMFTIRSYNSGLNPLQNPKLSPAVLPTNQTDCEATELRFFVWSGSTLRASADVDGVWQGPGDGCRLSLSAPGSLAAGATYKFAISGRRLGTLVSVRVEHPYR